MLKQFEKQQYLNIETFRKNGQGVKTPVWFAQDGETLLIWTGAGSGKTKRILRDSKVRIVPSTASGEPVGEWVNAKAAVESSEDKVIYTETLFKNKYGFMFRFLSWLNKSRGRKYASIRVYFN